MVLPSLQAPHCRSQSWERDGGGDVSIPPAMVSSRSPVWETPQPFFDALNAEFQFVLDVCALPANAKCERFLTPQDDGLAQPWAPATCWMNPPYGREIGMWMRKGAGGEPARCHGRLSGPRPGRRRNRRTPGAGDMTVKDCDGGVCATNRDRLRARSSPHNLGSISGPRLRDCPKGALNAGS